MQPLNTVTDFQKRYFKVDYFYINCIFYSTVFLESYSNCLYGTAHEYFGNYYNTIIEDAGEPAHTHSLDEDFGSSPTAFASKRVNSFPTTDIIVKQLSFGPDLDPNRLTP